MHGTNAAFGKPLAQPDVILRRHVIELDGDAAVGDAGLLERIGENVGRILRELIVGPQIAEARALAGQILLDVDHDLGGEAVAGDDGDGTAEAIAGVTRHQKAGGVGDVVLREGDERVMARLSHRAAQLAEDLVLHRCHSSTKPFRYQANELGRRLAGEPELLEREPLAGIIDANREPGEMHERIDRRSGHRGEARQRRHRHQAIAHVLMHVAMVERGRRLDGGVGGAFLAGAADVAAVARRPGGQPGIAEGVEERGAGDAERGGNGHALAVDGGGDAADRWVKPSR